MMRLLLTGFEPFGGSTVNPSEQVARTLAGQIIRGVAVHAAVLPVARGAGPAALLRAVADSGPDAVLCLGEAARRAVISIERVAVNLLDYGIPDNAGELVVDEPVVPDGPAAYFVTLPVRAMLAAVREAGVPAELSLSAGAFLCNQVTYQLLHELDRQRRPIRAGFIHLPPLPEQVAGRTTAHASMGLDTLVTGITAAIGALAPLGAH